jgi:hypothetical protein
MPQALYKTRGRDQREQLPPSKVFQTTIYLPAGASRSNVVHGDEHANIKSAKNAAALKAIKQLHSEGKMTDFLHPSWGSKRRARQLGKHGYVKQLRQGPLLIANQRLAVCVCSPYSPYTLQWL